MSEAPVASSKVVVLVIPVGSAPGLADDRFRVDRGAPFAAVVQHLRRALGRGAADAPLFCYLRRAFTPGLDERVGALFDAFGADGRLAVWYSVQPAWG